MKTLRTIIFALSSIALLGAYHCVFAQVPAAMPPMTPEEQALAQQLDSVFTELTKNMSDKEKDQFYSELNTAMEDEIDKMSHMSDEDLNKYIENAESELKSMGPWPEQPPAAPPVEVAKPQVPPVKEVPKKVEKPIRDMAPILEDITAHLESFITKVSKITDMGRYIERWGAKGTLRNWNKTITWPVFKEKVELLKKTVYTIKSIDPKTQKAKHLVDLAENAELCNNLTKFRTNLVQHEPGIKAPTPGKKLSRESKAAIKAVIGDVLEAIQVFNIQAELDKIIAKYEPTAKKIKEAEEAAAKKAQEEFKKPKGVRPATIAAPSAPEVGYYVHGPVSEQRPGGPGGFGAYQPPAKEEKGLQPSAAKPGAAGPSKPAEGEKKPAGPSAPAKKDEKKESKAEEYAIIQFNQTRDEIVRKMDQIDTAMNEEEPFNDQALVRQKMANPDKLFVDEIAQITRQIIDLNAAVLSASSTLRNVSEEERSKLISSVKKDIWGERKNDFMAFPDELSK